jgi:hypothetical protein
MAAFRRTERTTGVALHGLDALARLQIPHAHHPIHAAAHRPMGLVEPYTSNKVLVPCQGLYGVRSVLPVV